MQILKERIAFGANELAAERLRVLGDRRWPRFLAAQEAVVRLTELRWIRDNVGPPTPAPEPERRWTAERLEGARLVGAYPLEHHEQGSMRWTEPAAQLLLPPDAGPGELALDTGAMRGAPLDYLGAVYVGGRRLPRRALQERDGSLLVPIAEGGQARVTLLCRPLVPAAHGSTDTRRLGMPIFSAELLS